MVSLDLSRLLETSCASGKKECLNCHTHFMALRPLISAVVVTKRFFKDFKDDKTAQAVVADVLDCSNVDYSEMHKFEAIVGEALVFRAKKGGVHSVYVVDKKLRVIFLRAFRNFNSYDKFLKDKNQIRRLVLQV